MGGSITVESRPGEGSSFSFTLLLPLGADEAAPVPAPDLAGRRVLIVDDNEVNRRVLTEQVTSWGMRYGSYAEGHPAFIALRAALQEGDPYISPSSTIRCRGSMVLGWRPASKPTLLCATSS